jgi:hypothetical protein
MSGRDRTRALVVRALASLFVAALCAITGSPAVASVRSSPPVTYTAKVFMRGMQVTVPSGGWHVHEDHPGEFNLAAPAGPMAGTNIHFWLDPVATGPDGSVLANVGRTPAALIEWLRHDADLVVSVPSARTIAGGLSAHSVDLDLAVSAPEEDPGCGAPCLGEFVFKGAHYDFDYGTGLGEPVRLYLARLSRQGRSHTFLVSVDAPSPAAFAAVIPIANRLLRHVKLPPTLSTG